MRTISSHRLNKLFSLRFTEDYLSQQTPEEGQRSQWLKCCNNNKVISLKVNNNFIFMFN